MPRIPTLFARTPHPRARAARRLWPALAALAAVSVAMAGTPAGTGRTRVPPARAAAAPNPAPAAVAARSWHGVGEADLAAQWSRWFMSIPLGVDPGSSEETGVNCGINQAGPVWFLGAPSGATYERSCTLPAGKAIAMPVIGYINDYPCPDPTFQPAPGQSLDAFLHEFAAEFVDATTYKSATLDGKPAPIRRIASALYPFTAPASLQAYDACVTGSPQQAVTDGYFVLVDPPAPGLHVLRVKVVNPFVGTTEGTFNLTVR